MNKVKKGLLEILVWLTGNTWWDRFGFELKKGIIYDIMLMNLFLGVLFLYNFPIIHKYYSLSVSFVITFKNALAFIGAFFIMIAYYNKYSDKMKPERRFALSGLIVLSFVLILQSRKKNELHSTFA